ncbi:SDR family NAD(P)-dependent oxidoreductase [Spirillospora sp. CA-255316]
MLITEGTSGSARRRRASSRRRARGRPGHLRHRLQQRRHHPAAKPVHELEQEDWENVDRTNNRGVYLSIKYEVPHMLGRGGVIICTASWSTRPGGAAYTASKRAIMGSWSAPPSTTGSAASG